MADGDVCIRRAEASDFEAIARIYNEGIEDRVATLDTDVKDAAALRQGFAAREPRYACLVAERATEILGWASLNPYSQRCAYDAVADLSIYVRRDARGSGVGNRLLAELELRAKEGAFHKIVLFTLPFNEAGQRLYRKRGFREVGVFREQGRLDGRSVDVMAMEKLL